MTLARLIPHLYVYQTRAAADAAKGNVGTVVHPGPEAWYVVAGDQCLEIPGRKIELHTGEGGFVPEGPPMVLLGTGTRKRQALALILHDSSRPMTLPAADWTPTGLCTVK
jgi:hypothetical protein